MRRLLGFAAAAMAAAPLMAHPGGLNAEGCHNNRKTGDYHCHGGGRQASGQARSSGVRAGGGRVYANCSEARAAGAAPVMRGDAGYGAHLDRDNDGVGCE